MNTTPPLPEWMLAYCGIGGLQNQPGDPEYLVHLHHPFLIARAMVIKQDEAGEHWQPRLILNRLQKAAMPAELGPAPTGPDLQLNPEQARWTQEAERQLYLTLARGVEHYVEKKDQTIGIIHMDPEVVWNSQPPLPNLLAGVHPDGRPEAFVISPDDPFLVATFDTEHHTVKQIVHLDVVKEPITGKLSKLIVDTLSQFYRQAFKTA